MSRKLIREWLEEHENYLYGVANKRAAMWQDIEDLKQYLALRLMAQAHTYDETQPLLRWVRSQVGYAMGDWTLEQRKHANQTELKDYIRAPARAPAVSTDFATVPLWSSLDAIDHMIVIRLDCGLSIAEIQQQVACPAREIKQRIRAMQVKYRDYLNPEN